MKNKTTSPAAANGGGNGNEWEMRPGGMLVQKRGPDSENLPPPPNIRVRVKYGSIYHEISISSQATFGELKKMLTGPTGMHHEDQKLLFKDKERDSKAFLDTAGVKDKSKIVLIEDPISKEKRYLEMRKNAKMEKAAKTISEISLEVDRLAGQVSALESVISKGGKVAEKSVINVIESLMTQLVRLDGIVAEGDVKVQRKTQVARVQKYVETLDVLKLKNSAPTSNGNHSENLIPTSNGNHTPIARGDSFGNSPVLTPKHQVEPSRHSASGPVVITTQWETFDPAPAPLLDPFSTATSTSGSAHPRVSWDLLS
nr:BAG family molecular chaperone regulator 1-like [Ipomoea trifida]